MPKIVLVALLLNVPITLAQAPFAGIQGDQFVCDGQVYKLKGTNYYPARHMWQHMWEDWDWQEIQAEAEAMRVVNMNCARILVPYTLSGWNGPNVPESRLKMLEDLVNLLGDLGIRSCVTLFDWETTFPPAGLDGAHRQYLSRIVTRLKDNPYVLFWDVKNEPDHPDNYGWCDCSPKPGICEDWDCNPTARDKIINWLDRMCSAVRAIDTKHPVTAGMRGSPNVPQVLSFVDIAICHSYNWFHIGYTYIPALKSATVAKPKPILIEEFGWPTYGPDPAYNEAEQLKVYTYHLNAFEQFNIAGGLQWMTFDTDNRDEDWYGLMQFNGGYKPATTWFRDHYVVQPFPYDPRPKPLSSFTVTPGPARLTCSWKTSWNLNLKGVVIRARLGSPPASPTDGTLICDVPAARNTSSSYVDQRPLIGQTVYYAAYAYTTEGLYSSALTGTARVAAPCDFDGDNDVDQTDFGRFQACMTGPFSPQNDPACLTARLDGDMDVDAADFAIFRKCFGPTEAPVPSTCLRD